VLENDTGNWKIEPGSGGLVSALGPVLKERGGTWIGWPGTSEDAPFQDIFKSSRDKFGYEIIPVPLDSGEVDDYYYGFSNETLWPLFHNMLGRAAFNRDHWDTYRRVNKKFADITAATAAEDDFIWVQDYQLLLVSKYLKNSGPALKPASSFISPSPPRIYFFVCPGGCQSSGRCLAMIWSVSRPGRTSGTSSSA